MRVKRGLDGTWCETAGEEAGLWQTTYSAPFMGQQQPLEQYFPVGILHQPESCSHFFQELSESSEANRQINYSSCISFTHAFLSLERCRSMVFCEDCKMNRGITKLIGI